MSGAKHLVTTSKLFLSQGIGDGRYFLSTVLCSVTYLCIYFLISLYLLECVLLGLKLDILNLKQRWIRVNKLKSTLRRPQWQSTHNHRLIYCVPNKFWSRVAKMQPRCSLISNDQTIIVCLPVKVSMIYSRMEAFEMKLLKMCGSW